MCKVQAWFVILFFFPWSQQKYQHPTATFNWQPEPMYCCTTLLSTTHRSRCNLAVFNEVTWEKSKVWSIFLKFYVILEVTDCNLEITISTFNCRALKPASHIKFHKRCQSVVFSTPIIVSRFLYCFVTKKFVLLHQNHPSLDFSTAFRETRLRNSFPFNKRLHTQFFTLGAAPSHHKSTTGENSSVFLITIRETSLRNTLIMISLFLIILNYKLLKKYQTNIIILFYYHNYENSVEEDIISWNNLLVY